MGTQDARKLKRTAHWSMGDDLIVFDPVFRTQPEPGYWLELALIKEDSDWRLGNELAGRLGPLSGALSGAEPVFEWRAFQRQALGIVKAMFGSRPDLLAKVTDADLRDRLMGWVINNDTLPRWSLLTVAATELVRFGDVALSSLTPTRFDAPTAKGKVLAYGLNEAMKAEGISACKKCGTVFVTAARPRDYCTPACRKEFSIQQKEEGEK